MFKQIATGILLLCLTLQTLSSSAIVGSYYVNKDSFARNCVNKAKPQLHCNGKCQMLKKLQQEEKKDSQNPERRNNGKETVISSKSFFAVISLVRNYIVFSYAVQPVPPIIGLAHSIFHPPCF